MSRDPRLTTKAQRENMLLRNNEAVPGDWHFQDENEVRLLLGDIKARIEREKKLREALWAIARTGECRCDYDDEDRTFARCGVCVVREILAETADDE